MHSLRASRAARVAFASLLFFSAYLSLALEFFVGSFGQLKTAIGRRTSTMYLSSPFESYVLAHGARLGLDTNAAEWVKGCDGLESKRSC